LGCATGRGSARLAKGWTWPWLVFGSNAIVAVHDQRGCFEHVWVIAAGSANGHPVTLEGFLAQHTVRHIANPGWSAFRLVGLVTAVCWLPVWVLWAEEDLVKIWDGAGEGALEMTGPRDEVAGRGRGWLRSR